MGQSSFDTHSVSLSSSRELVYNDKTLAHDDEIKIVAAYQSGSTPWETSESFYIEIGGDIADHQNLNKTKDDKNA